MCDDVITLKSGKEVYAHAMILGIAPDLRLTYGYDGRISDSGLSADDVCELADIAIDRWTRLKAALTTHAPSSYGSNP